MKYLLKKVPDAEIVTPDSTAGNLSQWYSQKPVVLTIVIQPVPWGMQSLPAANQRSYFFTRQYLERFSDDGAQF
jgi:hypothetical protein